MKRLVSAKTIRQEHASGATSIVVDLAQTIITPEARSVASALGIEFIASDAPPVCSVPPSTQTVIKATPSASNGIRLCGSIPTKESRLSADALQLAASLNHPALTAGFLCWENSYFPVELARDEVQYLFEGELLLTCEGESLRLQAGDVLFLPKSSKLELKAIGFVRLFYVVSQEG